MAIKREYYSTLGLDRYYFDFGMCSGSKGFCQVDNHQDAWYYGQWINPFSLRKVSYCEGDVYEIECDTVEEFVAEVERMMRFYVENAGTSDGIGIDAKGTLGGDLLADMGLGEWVH